MALLSAALAALALTGCGGDDEPAAAPAPSAAPSGSKTLPGPGYALAYPAAWTVQPEQRTQTGTARNVLGPRGRPASRPRSPSAAPRRAPASRRPRACSRPTTGSAARGGRCCASAPSTSTSTAEAQMIEARYMEVVGQGTEPVRTVDVLVKTRSGAQLDVLLRAPESDFEPSGLRKVLDTLKVS